MEVLQIFGSWDQEIDLWFTNHQPLIPTLYYLHSLRKQTIFTVINTHWEKLCLQEFTEIEAWMLLTLFICLHKRSRSMHSIVTYYRVQMFEKGDNEWLLFSASFTAKLELVFVLTQESAFP